MATRSSGDTSGIGLVCEDKRHCEAAHILVGDALATARSWLTVDDEAPMRAHSEDLPFTCLTNLEAAWNEMDPRRRRPRPHGLIAGKPQKPEADMFRSAALLFFWLETPPALLVFVRDLDGHSDRVDGFLQIRESFTHLPFAMVLAAPQPEIEAWYVSGFQPVNSAEQRRADGAGLQLNFSPVRDSEALTSRPNEALTDAKRVFQELFAGDEARAVAALRHAARVATADRGPRRLHDFLRELDEVVQRFTSMRNATNPGES